MPSLATYFCELWAIFATSVSFNWNWLSGSKHTRRNPTETWVLNCHFTGNKIKTWRQLKSSMRKDNTSVCIKLKNAFAVLSLPQELMKAKNMINILLTLKEINKIFKRATLEEADSKVKTGLVKQLSFCLVWAQSYLGERREEKKGRHTMKSLIQGHLEMSFLKPQKKNNDLAS